MLLLLGRGDQAAYKDTEGSQPESFKGLTQVCQPASRLKWKVLLQTSHGDS